MKKTIQLIIIAMLFIAVFAACSDETGTTNLQSAMQDFATDIENNATTENTSAEQNNGVTQESGETTQEQSGQSAPQAAFTADELAEINTRIKEELPYEDWDVVTYDDILSFTNGVHAQVIYDENGNYEKHWWGATDSNTANFFIEFSDAEALVGISRLGYSHF